ncbi:MAG: hypothetical protein M3440_14250, partial [Chloroflexota bacterium]|nr:hypothetical protein [Chloroflexota bacterium]
MTDAPAAAPVAAKPATPPGTDPGIIAREEQAAIEAIRQALLDAGVDPGSRPIDLRSLPFEGTWGSASAICRIVAGDLVTKELTASGALEGLSKKETKRAVNEGVGARAQQLAEEVAATMAERERFAAVEAVNGYI